MASRATFWQPVFGAVRQLCSWALLVLIRAYQVAIRPHLSGACQFYPTCSEYAAQAVRIHGPWRGAWLALRRLGRCRPLSPGGYDPVPPRSA